MSYHTGSTTTTATVSANAPARSTTYVVGSETKTAPLGYHYMPNGELMSDVSHIEKYGGSYKIIENIVLDTSDISISKITSLPFKVIGDNGAVFSLQVKDIDNNKYYDFTSSSFVSKEKMLSRQEIRGVSFSGAIKFPVLSAATKYEIYLLADYTSGTKHIDYAETRDSENNIDVNASKGSNSLMLYKEIYQTADQVLTITPISVNSDTNFSSVTMASSTSTINFGGSLNKAAFEVKVTQANGKAVSIDRQPTAEAFAARAATTLDAEVASYTADYVGTTSHYWLKEDNTTVATPRSTDTVDGAVSTNKIVMDNNVASKMKVGDRVTGTGIATTAELTVLALNPDGDNVKEFSVSAAVEIDDGTTLSFTPPHYFRYNSVSDILDIPIGAQLIGGDADGITALTNTSGVIATRVTTIEPIISKAKTRDNTTKIAAVAATGNITFNKKLPEDVEGEDFFFYGYGTGNIKTICGWDIEISNVKAELTTVTTTTTGSTSSSTSVNVTSGHGVMDDVTVVSSPNMNRAVANPTVTNIASYDVSSAATATLTLSSAQTFESGETLTFSGAGQIVTITGDIFVRKAGVTNTIFLNIDNFLTGTTETS